MMNILLLYISILFIIKLFYADYICNLKFIGHALKSFAVYVNVHVVFINNF